ncbi:pleckstrin homology and RUN domain containing M1 [Haematobia irritans]|uniref:pleckstrin homology and RUN domain containing M1 n=1 Tax=Haematobia irritans TaxID=7368 RepID=UPI003F4FD20E
MSSLFRSFSATKREGAVKDAILDALQENVREIEYDVKDKQEPLELCESTSSLSTSIEAIFLHGLKDSFLWQTLNVITEIERRPEPSFWSPIMVFLHKEVIEQIMSLSQLTSEIGQCRAWIRLSLNEGLISSYLNNMNKNSSSLNPYYKKYALMKDTVRLERAVKYLNAVENAAQFQLPFNSSLLNQWPDYSLQLSGLWTPTLKSCPISSGLDVVGSLVEETMAIPMPQPLCTNELFSESISNSPFRRSTNFPVEELNTRMNIDLFLQKVDEMEEDDESKEIQDTAQVSSETTKRHTENQENILEPTPSGSNSLSNLMQKSWCSEVTSLDIPSSPNDDNSLKFQRSLSLTSSVSSLRSPAPDRYSYNTLLRKHERQCQVDWTEVWETFLLQNAGGQSISQTTLNNCDDDCESNKSDFEVVSGGPLEKFDITELQEMVEQLCKLAREPGLDGQGFLCKSCQHPLGIGYSNFSVCAFSGYYFCDNCMDIEPVIIPAKIIYNWDFRKYFVSKKAASFLAEFRTQPFIDLKLLNPDIYNASEGMAELQALRIRLNFIRAYLCTCSPKSFEQLQCLFFGKEYLYEHIHQYSIGDLGMIQRGLLFQLLQKAFKIGEAHILKCPLCSLKGFICEICNGPRILYPFHIETTYRCSTCGAVFHSDCLNEKQPCPKCERQRKRSVLSQESKNIASE